MEEEIAKFAEQVASFRAKPSASEEKRPSPSP